jgi:hypothetical protein
MALGTPDDFAFFEDSLPEWGIPHIWLARDSEGNVYYPVRLLIDALHLQRTDQTSYIQADSRTRKGVKTIKSPTRGGAQDTLYLRKREVAIWLANLDPERVNGVAKGRLNEFQEALWNLAQRTVFKMRRSAAAGAEDAGELLSLVGILQTEFVCDCGRRHMLRLENGQLRVFHLEEV